MNPLDHRPISVITPISLAFERVKIVLFRPFDFTRWLVVGFTAFLATLGESGGWGGFNFSNRNRRDQTSFNEFWDRTWDYIRDNLVWIVPATIALFVLAAAIGLLVLWLSSRGRFMFLDNVATNRAEVVRPWTQFQKPGNSLFWFRLGLGLAGALLVAPFATLGGYSVFAMLRQEAATPAGIATAVAAFGLVALTSLAYVIVAKLTKDFVIPIMWRQGSGWRAGWSAFGGLLGRHFWWFALYLLWHVALNIAITVIIMAVVLLTCCVAGCLIAIPYLGTVLLLPILVFLRSYSAFFLAQFGPEFDVFPKQGASPAA